MTQQDWAKCIVDAMYLKRKAKDTDSYVYHMSDALDLSLRQMKKDDNNDILRDQDKEDLVDLVKKLGNYTVTVNKEQRRINLTAEYDELCDILERNGYLL